MIADGDRRIIEEIAAEYQAKQVVLFGSSLSSQGESRDIDIGVEGIAEEDFFTFYGELLCALSKPVDVVDLSIFSFPVYSPYQKESSHQKSAKGASKMIYEIRTYVLAVGTLTEVEKRFGEAYEHRKKYSELAAFWHTDIGPLNEIIHVWPYRDLAERARVRAEAFKDPNWPPKIGDFVRSMQSEILVPFLFSPLLTPGKFGPIYEMRQYTVKLGKLPDLMKNWEAKLAGRLKLSPLAVAGNIDLGEANRFIHIWPYNSLDQRTAIRSQAVQLGLWPPGGGSEQLLNQVNKIMLPAAFSPMQ